MTYCSDCAASRICSGHHRLFNPACIYCGGRLIQAISRARKGITPAEITQRRRVVLADWMAAGHPEQELRDLAKSKSPALQPEQTKERK